MMKIDTLPEPELEFGVGRHIDIRFGLTDFGPFDVTSDVAPKAIKVGIVGTPATVEGMREWLERCRTEVPAKQSRQPHLYPRFPGFRDDVAFHSDLVLDASLERTIPVSVFDDLQKAQDNNRFVTEATEAFRREFEYLHENARPSLLICAVPSQLEDLMDPGLRPVAKEPGAPVLNFHHLLKATCMDLPPVQLVLPGTYDPTMQRRQKIKRDRLRVLQDEATRAWNLHTALYYKAGGLPWRLVRDPSQFSTCYIGISFYESLNRAELTTSMAQVFDERGEGMVVKGAGVRLSKDDRTPHLGEEDAGALVTEALVRYRAMHGTQPARVVVHKTSQFNEAELSGCRSVLRAERIDHADFLSVTRSNEARLFRNGAYPPLRGTYLTLDTRSHILYTRGSVPFYSTYPGMYVPRPLTFLTEQTEATPRQLAREFLALSKMNWNKTQFDGGLPITIEAAKNVGRILKYVRPGLRIAQHYRHYM